MDQLSYLQCLLSHLPSSLPCPDPEDLEYSELTELIALGLDINPRVLERTSGDKVQAVHEILGTIFVQDGQMVINECSPTVCAVVDMLHKYLQKYPGDPQLEQWIERII
jgi:hypothetical protein